MTHEASPAGFSSPGNYRTNITALGIKPGTLSFDGGRLSFVGQDGHVFFEAPIEQFHSVGLAEMNETLEIWQGSTRHRVSLATAGAMFGQLQGEFESDTAATRWRDYLAPLAGPVPAGVKVKKPVSKGVQLTITLVLSLLLVIAVIVAVVMLG